MHKLSELTEAGKYPYQITHVPTGNIINLLGHDELGYIVDTEVDFPIYLSRAEWEIYKSSRDITVLTGVANTKLRENEYE